MPENMIKYIIKVYAASSTVLQHDGWESEKIHPTCGVKQGDLLSSYIFNFIMDELLKRIPEEIGVDLDGIRVSIMAYADDLILIATAELGLQELLILRPTSCAPTAWKPMRARISQYQ